MCVIARSKNLLGPYEPCPHNPILTNIGKNLPIKAIGHADFLEDQTGKWWAVALGNRPLGYPFRHNMGRETMLVSVQWDENGWPTVGEKGTVLPTMETESTLTLFQPSKYIPGVNVSDHFNGDVLYPSWNYIYMPLDDCISLIGKSLQLRGNAVKLSEDKPKAWLGRRQEHFFFSAEAEFYFSPTQNEEEVGLSIYMNPGHHYEIVMTRLNDENCVIVRRRIGSLSAVEAKIPIDTERFSLRIDGDQEWYRFFYAPYEGKMKQIGMGEAAYLTTEVGGCLTGNYIALFSSGNGKDCVDIAEVTRFDYTAR